MKVKMAHKNFNFMYDFKTIFRSDKKWSLYKYLLTLQNSRFIRHLYKKFVTLTLSGGIRDRTLPGIGLLKTLHFVNIAKISRILTRLIISNLNKILRNSGVYCCNVS